MKQLQLVHEGALYRNPYPGHQAVCAFQPNVVALSDDHLLCLYRVGQAFYSLDGKLAAVRSTDGGRTWSEPVLAWDPRNDQGAGYTYGAPHGSRIKDGSLLMVAHRTQRREEDFLSFNPDTGGSRPSESVLLRSADEGRTWSRPEVLELPDEPVIDTPSSIIELNDGRWFLAGEIWKAWNDPAPLHVKGFAVFSPDQGRTWTDRVDFPSAARTDRMYSHSRYTRMRDGRVAALQWCQEVGGDVNHDLHLVISDTSGRKWSDPQPTAIKAQTCWLGDLGGGTLVMTYSVREGRKPGVMVASSYDEGRTWDMDHQVMVWDAVGQEFLGVQAKPSYPASHENIAFGKPNTAVLPCGDVISSWWCTQASVTHIRYARLTLA